MNNVMQVIHDLIYAGLSAYVVHCVHTYCMLRLTTYGPMFQRIPSDEELVDMVLVRMNKEPESLESGEDVHKA